MRRQWRLIHLLPSQPQPIFPFFSKIPSRRPKPFTFSVLAAICSPSDDVIRSTARQELARRVLILKNKLVDANSDSITVYRVLEQMGLPLFSSYYDGSAMVELLTQLANFPHLGLLIFNWRRKHAALNCPVAPQEYARGIAVAGRAKNVDLAVELFTEAVNKCAKTSKIYNSLMSVYMMSGMPDKCQSLFSELQRDAHCRPTVVTYNILISVFGRMMLVDRMEAMLREMYNAGLSPNLGTFNNLIIGYITAWMWNRMEDTFMMMKVASVKPDRNTFMLMLRGYAHSGNLEKMEEIYELGKPHFGEDNVILIRLMICAYCKRSCACRVEKIDSLVRLIPECEFRSWLNKLLIKVYAEERELERMEKCIDVAFEQHTALRDVRVMHSIITAYYNTNDVDKLTRFEKRAETAGWIICSSLYHCKMVMFAYQNRLEEMENVVAEMGKNNIPRTKKTWAILYNAYSHWGPKWKLEQVKGLMYKCGIGIPSDDCPT